MFNENNYDFEDLFLGAFDMLKKASPQEVILDSFRSPGMMMAVIGYVLGAVPIMITLTTSRSIYVKCFSILLSLFLLTWYTVSGPYPESFLYIFSYSISVVCTYAQIESAKMICGHLRSRKMASKKGI